MTVRVRAPAAADRAPWSDLWAQYNAFYGRSGDMALAPEVVETTWSRLLDPAEPVQGLVAEWEEGLVGLVHVVFHRNLIHLQDTCYMQDLFTAPASRGAGVARALIAGVTELCRARDVRDVYWHTREDNVAARQLYDRVARDTGFVVYRMGVE